MPRDRGEWTKLPKTLKREARLPNRYFGLRMNLSHRLRDKCPRCLVGQVFVERKTESGLHSGACDVQPLHNAANL